MDNDAKELVRQALADLGQVEEQIATLGKRIKLIKRDLAAALGQTRPATAQKNDEYIGAGGKKIDLSKYRFKKPAKG
jgi:hypothetical protein